MNDKGLTQTAELLKRVMGTDFDDTLDKLSHVSEILDDLVAVDVKVGTNLDVPGTTTLFARLRQIVDSYLADGSIGLSAIISAINGIIVHDLTKFDQETAVATDANGTSWVTILDKSTITKVTRITGMRLTKAGVWIGVPSYRIVTGADVKIFPYKAENFEVTDWSSGIEQVFDEPITVPIANGYKVQFRSDNAGDGIGETIQLNNLNIIEIG